MVAGLLATLLAVTTNSAVPDTFAGTTALTCHKPMKPGARPLNATIASWPSMVTVGVITDLDKGDGEPGAGVLVGNSGLTGPSAVAKMTIVSPCAAGLSELIGALFAPCKTAACVPSEVKIPG